MSTMIRDTSETSVTFSLAELAKLEQERVREEDARRARTREREARALHEAEANRRAEEAARVEAEAETRARRAREDAAAKVRAEARERAAADVARIEADARARLEADNAGRAHELALLRVRAEGGHRRATRALAVALGLVVCGGGAAAYGAARRVESLEEGATQLREARQALAQEGDHARTTALAALDRRHAALRARPLAASAGDALATAEAARTALDARSPDHEGLRAFGDALDGLDARVEALEKLSALDRRAADLGAWAAERKRSDLAAEANRAAARAKAACADEALHAYEGALDRLREALAQPAARPGAPPPRQAEVGKRVCVDSDPGCGLDGRPLF